MAILEEITFSFEFCKQLIVKPNSLKRDDWRGGRVAEGARLESVFTAT